MIQKLIFSAFLALVTGIPAVNAAPDCNGTTASACPAGCYFQSETCTICPSNTFSTASGSAECTPCPESHPYAPSGADKKSACYKTCTDRQDIELGYKTASKNAQFNTECNYDVIHCVANATNKSDKCTCNDGYEANADKTACEPKNFKITLNKNCTICTVKNGEFFEKYNVGFSNTETGTFVSGYSFKADLSKLDISRWGYEFKGYFTATSNGTKILDEQGRLMKKDDSTQFSSNTTLYAQWNGKDYTIHYTGDKAPDAQTCKFGTNCRISNITETQACQVFKGWKCTSGCKEQITINPNTTFDESNINNTLQITLTAQWAVCRNGYYCENGQEKQCSKPGSTTTNTATQCATKETDCYISNVTMFKDSNGSFSLPIEANIQLKAN